MRLRQWQLCVSGPGAWRQRGGGWSDLLLQTGPHKAPSVVAGRKTPTPAASGGHTHPVSMFCLFWEWAQHWARWESLSVPHSALAGVWMEPVGWAAHHLLVGCHPITLLPGNKFLGEPFLQLVALL